MNMSLERRARTSLLVSIVYSLKHVLIRSMLFILSHVSMSGIGGPSLIALVVMCVVSSMPPQMLKRLLIPPTR